MKYTRVQVNITNNNITSKKTIIVTSIAIGLVITLGVIISSHLDSFNFFSAKEPRLLKIKPKWVDFNSTVDQLPADGSAFIAGTNSAYESIYVCRVNHSGGILPGTYDPIIGLCQVTYGGAEYKYDSFHLLTCSDPTSLLTWIPAARNPPGLLVGGISNQDYDLYIVRTLIAGNHLIGKAYANAYVPVDGKERQVFDYEVLCLLDFDLDK